jgi:hypothetical protein
VAGYGRSRCAAAHQRSADRRCDWSTVTVIRPLRRQAIGPLRSVSRRLHHRRSV